jgi:nitrogen regulatory protein PII
MSVLAYAQIVEWRNRRMRREEKPNPVRMKMLIAIVDDQWTERVMDAARQAGAAGATLIQEARGQGRKGSRALLGLELDSGRDVILFIVPWDRSNAILESVAQTAGFDDTPGTGLICDLEIEDSLGLRHQFIDAAAPSAAAEPAP